MSYLDVKIDASLLEKLADQLERETKAGGGDRGPIGKSFHAAGAAYMGFIRERFVDYSRGGGDWQPLAASTLRSRRKGRKTQGKKRAGQTSHILGSAFTGDAAILVNTANLLGSIGSFQVEDISNGVRVGVGTSVNYAIYHQQGTARMPARPIFVEPNRPTQDQIQRVLERGYQESVAEFDRQHGK